MRCAASSTPRRHSREELLRDYDTIDLRRANRDVAENNSINIGIWIFVLAYLALLWVFIFGIIQL